MHPVGLIIAFQSTYYQVIDLLNPGAKRSNLTVRWNKRSRAFVVDNLFNIECGELDDLVAVLEVYLILTSLALAEPRRVPGCFAPFPLFSLH